jgi:hypothetical protein
MYRIAKTENNITSAFTEEIKKREDGKNYGRWCPD